MKFPFGDYKEETIKLLENFSLTQYKLYSFELKIEITFDNLKESYFQAVSNSSFANEGYLVVFKPIDSEVLEELRRLNASFGIGVIALNTDVLETKVVLSAKEKPLDLQTLDYLIEINEDFRNFIGDIDRHIDATKRGHTPKVHFDNVLNDDELERYLTSKKIPDSNL